MHVDHRLSVFFRPEFGQYAQQMFQYVVLNPIPASVTKLEGVGDTWQVYSLYLGFTASKTDIDALIPRIYAADRGLVNGPG